jgi:hypothetical protein
MWQGKTIFKGIHVCVCVYIYVCVRVYVCMHACMYLSMYVCMCVCVCVLMCLFVCVNMLVCDCYSLGIAFYESESFRSCSRMFRKSPGSEPDVVSG